MIADQIFSDKDEYKRRLTICENCDRKSILNICKECGCLVIAKAKLLDATCPLDKWKDKTKA